MSTHVTIVKKPSHHNLLVQVNNPGTPNLTEHLLKGNEAVEVLVWGGSPTEQGGGTITLSERDKPAA